MQDGQRRALRLVAAFLANGHLVRDIDILMRWHTRSELVLLKVN